MKKQFITILLFLLMKNGFSQVLYTDFLNFENGLHQWIIDTSQVNNIWQVGKPSKIVFDSAFSAPNGIVTDTLHSYPANNLSSFIIKEPFQYVNHLSFQHKYDTDSGHAGGYIEISSDTGHTWANVITDTTIQLDRYSLGFYDTTQKITGGIPAFSGHSPGWLYAEYDWIMICLDARSNPDSVWLKFNFKSDSMQTGKEGWMIDDIYFEIDICSGIREQEQDVFELSPNPAPNQLTIHTSSFHQAATVSIMNMLGQEALSYSLSFGEGRGEADVSKLAAGMYFLQLKWEGGSAVKRFVKE